MALLNFTKNILLDKPINVFNYGDHKRDFTYIDDITEVLSVINKPAKPNIHWDSIKPDPSSSSAPYRIYNIGNNKPIKLMDYIQAIEKVEQKSNYKFPTFAARRCNITFADVDDLIRDFNYKPFNIETGISDL